MNVMNVKTWSASDYQLFFIKYAESQTERIFKAGPKECEQYAKKHGIDFTGFQSNPKNWNFNPLIDLGLVSHPYGNKLYWAWHGDKLPDVLETLKAKGKNGARAVNRKYFYNWVLEQYNVDAENEFALPLGKWERMCSGNFNKVPKLEFTFESAKKARVKYFDNQIKSAQNYMCPITGDSDGEGTSLSHWIDLKFHPRFGIGPFNAGIWLINSSLHQLYDNGQIVVENGRLFAPKPLTSPSLKYLNGDGVLVRFPDSYQYMEQFTIANKLRNLLRAYVNYVEGK